MNKFSKDGRCRFDSETHTYWIGEKQLTGITTFISQFKPKQDFDLIAENYAIKNKLDKNEVLAQWKEKGEISRLQGTQVHELIEKWFHTGEIYPVLKGKEKVAAKFIKDFFLSGRLKPIESELVVYDEELEIASMIDKIAVNPLGEHFVLDWKTNKEIKKEGWGRFMLYPFDTLPDADYYHYSLQVQLYKKMCKEYSIKDCFIVHIGEENYKIMKPEPINLCLLKK